MERDDASLFQTVLDSKAHALSHIPRERVFFFLSLKPV